MSSTDTSAAPPELFAQLFRILKTADDLPPADTPLGKHTREFFQNIWYTCASGLLAKTQRIRVLPEPNPPHIFHFEMDLPYKQKFLDDTDPVRLMPGPVRGVVIYRPDLLSNLHQPSVAVRLDPAIGFYHPNYSRKHGLICLGDLPPGPFPLDSLLEHHLFPILSYQNRRPSHPADVAAARYFATSPEAMQGLEPVSPLY